MKKTVSTATALSTAIVIALGGIALTGQAAFAGPAPASDGDSSAPQGGSASGTAGDASPALGAGTDAVEVDGGGPDLAPPTSDADGDAAGAEPEPSATGSDDAAPDEATPAEEVPAPSEDALAPAVEAPAPGEEDDEEADDPAAVVAPAAPVVESPAPDAFVSVSTAEGAQGSTLPVTVAGTAAPSAVVTITFERLEVDGASAGPVTVATDATGRWTSTTRLASGDWSVVTTQHLVDPTGERASEDSPASLSVEFRAVAVTLPAPTLDGPVTGDRFASVGGAEAAVTVTGGGEPGASVRLAAVAADGTDLDYDGSVPVDGAGRWSATVRVPVGTWELGAIQDLVVDAVTVRTSPNVVSGTFVVEARDRLAAPVVLSPREGHRFEQASDVTPGYVDTVFEGTGEPGAVLVPFSGTRAEVDQFLATVGDTALPPYDFPIVVGEDGTWAIVGSQLPGDYVFTAVQYDPAFTVPVFSAGADTVGYSVGAPTTVPAGAGGPGATPVVTVPGSALPVRAATNATALAYTGTSETTPWAGLAGLVLVGLGAATVLVTRRRASRG
jgi:LPXTG-motif cell wall-anchored protein